MKRRAWAVVPTNGRETAIRSYVEGDELADVFVVVESDSLADATRAQMGDVPYGELVAEVNQLRDTLADARREIEDQHDEKLAERKRANEYLRVLTDIQHADHASAEQLRKLAARGRALYDPHAPFEL